MSVADATRWDARYADRRVGDPSAPEVLVAADLIGLIPDAGRALDVACGAGRQAAWLACRGMRVTAVDVSPRAIELTRAAAARAGVAELVDAHVADLDDGLVERDAFDVILCQRFRDPGLYDAFVEHLRPGGIAILTVLSRTGATSPGPHHAPSNELLRAFDRPGMEILHHTERDGEESIVARRDMMSDTHDTA